MLALIKLASLEWSRWGVGGVEAERAKGGGGLEEWKQNGGREAERSGGKMEGGRRGAREVEAEWAEGG